MSDPRPYDRVEETTTTVGTAAFALAGATPGCQPFSVVGDGGATFYFAVDPVANVWECGIGTYHLSGHTLARDRILSSSSSGSIISFGAGTKYVFVEIPAEAFTFAVQEVPSGTVNGSNVAFTLSHTPYSNAEVCLYMNGLLQRQTADYTLSGVTITMLSAPHVGDGLLAVYRYH